MKPMAWEGLKRALKNQEVCIESVREAYGAISTRTLDPEPIPLDIKVIVIGDPRIYYLLYSLDEDFQELFKVKADFGARMDWDDGAAQQYARFIGTICSEEDLTHFAPSAVSRVVEHSARVVAHQKKVATKFGDIADLVRQASYWADRNGNDPQSNVKNLMLRDEVVKAVADGRFHVYPVSTVDEGIALLTGKEAGERGPDGDYAQGTVNAAVQQRLEQLAQKVKSYAHEEAGSPNGQRTAA